ncbi:MAG: hypothetical protein N3C57_00325 [Aquificaceae bacterium]|nr:hypothetical protein [Aquificaceae bacterium]
MSLVLRECVELLRVEGRRLIRRLDERYGVELLLWCDVRPNVLDKAKPQAREAFCGFGVHSLELYDTSEVKFFYVFPMHYRIIVVCLSDNSQTFSSYTVKT